MQATVEQVYLKIAKDFSETPGSRSRDEGDFSGDEFLERHLCPLYEKARQMRSTLLVDLDGSEGYATSFLESAFGGLARKFSSEEVLRILRFKSDDEPYLEDEIKRYIAEAND